jgi:hypothetical protein
MKIVYKTNNTIEKETKRVTQPKGKNNNSGVYQVKCSNCNKSYVGQMSWKFKTRYKEHIKDFINNKPNPGFSQDVLEMKHAYTDINECMDNLHVHRKGKYYNILEQLPI